ncbi:MAG TPA: ACP S-malonyltransferase [Rubrobacteraceae bacterium]|nr:ACP S-malonyltransferase [Rubrobacteraceae bacterium]
MAIRRAVVFPGQGSAGGEFTGVVRDAVERTVGDEEVPYQLSVFARSVQLLGELLEANVEPDVVAGHSLGEYAAAYAAGSLKLEDGARLVAERDQLMNEVAEENPGEMVALIGADAREVVEAVEAEGGVVVAANFNTPRQTVISGDPQSVEAVAGRVSGKSRKLAVAGAFHSPLMAEAAAGMEHLLAGVELKDPVTTMISGMDGGVLATAEDVRTALRRQMLSPVRWVAVIERFADLGVEEIVEAGDDGTLTRMLRDFKELDLKGYRAKEVLA